MEWGVTKVSSSVNVIGTGSQIGELVGYLRGSITNTSSLGNVTGGTTVGGLVGYQKYSTTTNSYSVGNVTGTTTGGLMDGSINSTTTNSYWNTETNNQVYSVSGTGKTTMQMKQQATYVGWDFTNTWTINQGNDYPKLK